MVANALASNSVRLGAAVLASSVVLYVIWAATSSSSDPKPPSAPPANFTRTTPTRKNTRIVINEDGTEQEIEEVVEISFMKTETTTVTTAQETVSQTDSSAEVTVGEAVIVEAAVVAESSERTLPKETEISLIKERVENASTEALSPETADDDDDDDYDDDDVVVVEEVSRELHHLAGGSQVTTVHKHEIQKDENQPAFVSLIHSQAEIIEEPELKEEKEDQEEWTMLESQVLMKVEEETGDEDQKPIQKAATQVSLTLSSESADEALEQEEEEKIEHVNNVIVEEQQIVLEEHQTVVASHTDSEVEEREEAVAEISISTSTTTTTTITMDDEQNSTLETRTTRAYTKLKEQEVEEYEESEDSLELDEQKAAEVDAMVNDDHDQVHEENVVPVTHNEGYAQEIRVDTTFYHAQPLDSLLSPKKTGSTEEFPGQREAAERIDKALAIAEAASPYSSVKSLIAPSSPSPQSSSPLIAPTTPVTIEETINGQSNDIREK
ncbi:hypothetical protein BGZ65_005352, partial [Modicella reniformis]